LSYSLMMMGCVGSAEHAVRPNTTCFVIETLTMGLLAERERPNAKRACWQCGRPQNIRNVSRA
jgi:hypothetical protein